MNWRNSINCKLYAIKSHNLWSHYKLNNNKTIEYTTYCYGNKDYKISVLLLHESYQLSSSPQQEHLANFCHELSFTWLQCTIHRNQFVIQVSIKPNNIYLQGKKAFSSTVHVLLIFLNIWIHFVKQQVQISTETKLQKVLNIISIIITIIIIIIIVMINNY